MAFNLWDIGGCNCQPCPPCTLPAANLHGTVNFSGFIWSAQLLTYSAAGALGSPQWSGSWFWPLGFGLSGTYGIAIAASGSTYEFAFSRFFGDGTLNIWYWSCPGNVDFIGSIEGTVTGGGRLSLDPSSACAPLNLLFTGGVTLTITP